MGSVPYILVVEDDKIVNELACRLLRMVGFSARGALDGNSALQMAQQEVPAVVLLDIMLPGMTGFDVCTSLKGNELTRRVPVILLTALDDDESRDRGVKCGAIEHVVKPYDPMALVEIIKKHAA